MNRGLQEINQNMLMIDAPIYLKESLDIGSIYIKSKRRTYPWDSILIEYLARIPITEKVNLISYIYQEDTINIDGTCNKNIVYEMPTLIVSFKSAILLIKHKEHGEQDILPASIKGIEFTLPLYNFTNG